MNIVTPKEVYENAFNHGFHNTITNIPEKLCLIHSEVSEALEAYRNEIPEGNNGCMSEELADIVIRVWDLAYDLDIDIVEAVNKKHTINVTRPYKHGGKRC